MPKGAWCHLNSNGVIFILHDMCPKPKGNCKKRTIFTPKQVQLEGNGFESKLKRLFKGSKVTWNKVLKPAVNVAAQFIGVAVGTMSKNPTIGRATTDILRSRSGNKVQSMTKMHENGLKL